MTVTAPPRPPRPSDPVDREELEALVEALIEEARQRARRDGACTRAVVTLVALAGVAVFAVLERTAQSQSASPAPPHDRALPPERRLEDRFHRAIRLRTRTSGHKELYVMNADGSGKRLLARDGLDGHCLVA